MVGRRKALRVAGVVLALVVAASATGAPPSQPQVVDPSAFVPVTVAPVVPVIRDTFPTPPPAPRPNTARKAKPIVIDNTPPKVVKPPVVVPGSLPSVADARAYARSRIGAAQFECLDVLWQHESGWRTHALNPSSGAYGIPQALPGDKMAIIAADWRDNPLTQVKWGLRYIAGRYGTACQALQHWRNHNWY